MKPQNVLLDGFGQAKLADFGIAGAAATVDAWTPGYAAPEQVAGHAEPRSDLFALGMTLAACALGRRPFGTGAAAMAAVEAIESHLTALHAELEHALPGLGTVLVTCLRHTPADRFPSASALAHALQGLRGSYASGPVLRRLVVLARPELATVSEPEPRNDETTLAVVRGNLRPRRDAFVGRADEVAELRRRLHRGERLVTLLGPGGAGKTSLATQVAHLEQDRLEGGAWFVDLSEATDPDGVRAAVSRAFDLELDPEEPRQLEAMLRAKGRALLVLDNLEQVVEAAAALISGWVTAAPQLSMVCTSRVPLDVRGEQRMSLGPLREDDAAALFSTRSGRQDPPDQLRPVLALLEGSPLAIELAAARVGAMTLDQFGERIAHGILSLRSTQRDLPPRQRSVLASLTWSWELLRPAARAALARLSLCEGGFDSRAAEAILRHDADDPWALDVLQELTDASLVQVDRRTGRFTMLVSVRTFAAGHLDSAEQHEAGLFHARWYAQYQGQPTAPEELDNFIAAVSRAAAAGDGTAAGGSALAAWKILSVRGPLASGIRLLGLAVAQNGPGSPSHVPVVSALATALNEAGDRPGAVAVLQAACATLPETSPELALRLAECGAGTPDERARWLDLAEAWFQAEGDGRLLVQVGLARCQLLRWEGEARAALLQLQEVLARARALGDVREKASALVALGVLHAELGEHLEARAHLATARQWFEAHGLRVPLARLLTSAGGVEWGLDQADEAEALYEAALRLQRQAGLISAEATTLLVLASVATGRYQLPLARQRCLEALRLQGGERGRRVRGLTLLQLARISLLEGSNTEALEHAADGCELLVEEGGASELEIAMANVLHASLENAVGRRASLDRLREAAAVLGRATAATTASRAHLAIGTILEDRGEFAEAWTSYAIAARDNAYTPGALVGAGLARLAARKGEDPAPWLDLAEAQVAGGPHRHAWALVLATRATLLAPTDPVAAALWLEKAEATCPRPAPSETHRRLAEARDALARHARHANNP